MASRDAALMRLEIAGSIPAMGGAGYSPDMVKQSFVGKSKKTVAGSNIGSVFPAYHCYGTKGQLQHCNIG